MSHEPPTLIYLDHNASSRIDPAVVDAMHAYERQHWGNAASQHRLGRAARAVLDDCRDRIVELLGGNVGHPRGDRLIFTSGATEANNLALCGLASDRERPIVISSIEHPSVTACAAMLEQRGWSVDRLPCHTTGEICIDEGRWTGEPAPQWVSLMLANHETGVVQPVARLVKLLASLGHRTRVHTDAVQAIGRIEVHFDQLGIDALSLSAHKFHGPPGIGALLIKSGLSIEPILIGGSQQRGERAGTEPVALVVGMRTALELALARLVSRSRHMRKMRDRLQQRLMAGDAPAVVNGSEPRLPNTLNIAWPGLDRQALLLALDLAGIACATGAACESGSSEPSPVLRAMGCPEACVDGALRFSLSHDVTEEQIDDAAARILCTVGYLRQRAMQHE